MSERCPACPGKHKCIGFSGPANSPYKFIGEAPGWEEERKGECFTGKTGREVNDGYMPLAGLRRPNVRIGNAIGCLPDRSQNKLKMSKAADRELIDVCAAHRLYPELRDNPASLLIPMGAFACYALDPTIDLELHHGRPYMTPYGMSFPMYHPSGGIHEPKKMLIIRTDWYNLRRYLKGQLELPFDEYEGLEDYGVAESPDEVYEDLKNCEEWPLACDTETTFERLPFCISYTVRKGRGRLIKADNQAALDQFQWHIGRWRAPILWHNWLFDNGVTDKMGLVFPRKRIVDTMVRAFILGNIPQGLKALSYRELGMKMLDFDDLVTPYSKPKVLAYYGNAAREDWPKPEAVPIRQLDGSTKFKQPHSMKTKLKTFFTTYNKNPEDRDVFEMWTKNWAGEQKLIEDKCGKWPGKCITHAAAEDWPKVIRYACRDSDALLRLYDVIQHMERRMRRGPQEVWRESAA